VEWVPYGMMLLFMDVSHSSTNAAQCIFNPSAKPSDRILHCVAL